MNKFNYKWNIKDGYPAPGIKKHRSKVFSTFACGGGSSMGYKLAGYDVIGANDIDPKMRDIYKANHNPKYYIFGSISEMKTMDLPEELFGLDILDGSPPCSTFSMAGNREKSWKKNKRFREGQSEQILSDLFFDFIDVAERLQPKIIMAENVKGMLLGNAKIYTKEIVKRLEKIGYKVQIFLFNAASMGVPQKRERIFFICQRKDLNLPKLKLKFNEKPIIYEKIKTNENTRPVTAPSCLKVWEKRKKGEKSLADTNKRIFGKTDFFNIYYIYENEVLKTITAADKNILFNEPRCLNKTELCLASSFPLDYDFGENKIEYVVGMSVPPVMMAQIANQIYEQWLSKLEI